MTISVMRKGRRRTIDARPMVRVLSEIEGGVVELQLETEISKAALKPVEIISSVLNLSEEEASLAGIRKIWSHGAEQA